MLTHEEFTRASLAVVLATSAVLAACGNADESLTAGQKLDLAVAEAKADGREMKADAKDVANEAAERLDKLGETSEAKAEQVGTAIADAAIVAALNAKIAQDKDLEASRIDVLAEQGRVTLRGTAPSSAAAARAVALAKGTDGVASVKSKLAIGKS